MNRATSIIKKIFGTSFFIVLSLLILSGCTIQNVEMYSPGTVSAEERVKIISEGSLQIINVDGKSVISTGKAIATGWKGAFSVYVSPGKHHITVTFFNAGFSANPPTLWLIAEAGKTYTIKQVVEGYGIKVHIEDSMGKIVGGLAGASDEPNP